MRCLFFLFFLPAIFTLQAAESATRTFYISGIECGSCVYMVQQSIAETKGVVNVTVVQAIGNYASVTFDPKAVSDQQIAQAVREAYPLHGMPYLASLKLSVANYASNASRVESLFYEWRKFLKLEVVDKAKGTLLVHFLPLEVDKKKASPRGWSLAQLEEAAIRHGVKFTLDQAGQ